MERRTVLTMSAAAGLAVAGLSVACASSSESGGASRSRNLITVEELMEVPHSSVYEAVRALRPRWLQARAGASMRSPRRETPRVYMDGQLFGGVDQLWTLLPGEVGELQFLSASDATTRFGTNHFAGAIVVTTRRR